MNFKLVLLLGGVFLVSCGEHKKTSQQVQQQESAFVPSAKEPEISEVQTAKPATPEARKSDNVPLAASFSKGEPITQADVLKRISLLPEKIQRLPFSQLYTLVLFVMIQEKLAYQAAIENQYDKRKGIAKKIQQMKQTLLQRCYLEEKTKGRVTDQAIEEQYKKMIDAFVPEDEVGLSHILVKTEEEAKQIIQQLSKNETSFEELRKMKSQDRHTKNGFLGYFRKEQLPEKQGDEILGTPVGKVVLTPIAVSKVGYSVLFVTDKRKSTPISLAEAKSQIQAFLSKKAILDYMYGLYKEKDVVFFEPDGTKRVLLDIDKRVNEAIEKSKQTSPSEKDKKREQSLMQLKESSIVAKIGAREIPFSTISTFIKEKPGLFSAGMDPYDVYVAACEEFINQEILVQILKDADISQFPKAQQQFYDAQSAFISQRYLSDTAKKMVTEEQLHQAYEKFATTLNKDGTEIRLKIIPVANLEEGKKAISQMKSGKKFDQVFDSFCIDPKQKAKKGDLGYLGEQDLKRFSSELYSKALHAAKGTLVPEPVEVNMQIWVVRVEDKRKIQVPDFKDLKSELRKQLALEDVVKVSLNMIRKDGTKAWDMNGRLIELSEKALEKSLGGVAQSLMARGM